MHGARLIPSCRFASQSRGYQPVASDMRYVGSFLTINKDLERIADLAVNMAEQAIRLAEEPSQTEIPLDLRAESERVRKMVKDSLDALVHLDVAWAEAVINADDEVDEIHRHVCDTVEERLRHHANDVSRMIEAPTISRQLERIADHTVNIAEDVIYMASGEIIRHNHSRNDVNRIAFRR